MTTPTLTDALTQADDSLLTSLPKSDLHNHGMLGFRRDVLRQLYNADLKEPPAKFQVFKEFEEYLNHTLGPYIPQADFFETSLRNSFLQAKVDGVRVLQMSIDSRFYYYLPGSTMTDIVERAHKECAPEIAFYPQLGMDRAHNFNRLMHEVESLLDTGFFKSIDLYGDELHGSVDDFIPIYRKAQQMGLILTAHVGEYGSAESVRTTAETLQLDQIQHGIAAADSVEVMEWLAAQKILLNVCPSSNVALCRAISLEHHPIRTLFDYGVRVSINTDDLFVFNQSVSDEYRNLHKAGVFHAEELEQIRQYGLQAFEA